jgi:dephospho-CoA kinase
VLLPPKSHPLTKEINLRTPVYGLTGGIASGKSTVLEQLAALDIDILDTDQLARDVIAPGTPGAQELEAAIGSQYFPGGHLDRVLLRSRIYESPALKQTVESIIHPLVRAAVNQWLNQESQSPYRILCSPLLIETKQHESLDGIIVVDVPESDQLLRGATRDTLSKETIQHIIDVQLPRDARLGNATFVIDNSGDLESLTQQIQTLHEKLSHDS